MRTESYRIDFMGIREFFRKLTARFWVLPALLVVLAILLAIGLTQLDKSIGSDTLRQYSWIFSGTPDSARTVLSVIASAAITIVAISFSITIIAIQQASAQYTTRVLRTFTADRGNQLVLGVYLASFTYSLLVLRAVQAETSNSAAFVPLLSITVAILLALIAIGVLVYFIQHISNSLQATSVIFKVHKNLTTQIDELYPEQFGKSAREPKPAVQVMKRLRKHRKSHVIKAERAGFISQIEESSLADINMHGAKWVYIMVSVGDFVYKGQPLIEIERYDTENDQGEIERKLKKTVRIGTNRSITQDPLFAIRQLVDIALKSLSPGINDQTSAVYSLHYIGDSLNRIGSRNFPVSARTFQNNPTCFVFSRPEWSTFVNLAFTQVRNVAGDKIFVMGSIIDTLSMLNKNVPASRRPPIVQQLTIIEQQLKKSSYAPADRSQLMKRVNSALRNR